MYAVLSHLLLYLFEVFHSKKNVRKLECFGKEQHSESPEREVLGRALISQLITVSGCSLPGWMYTAPLEVHMERLGPGGNIQRHRHGRSRCGAGGSGEGWGDPEASAVHS